MVTATTDGQGKKEGSVLEEAVLQTGERRPSLYCQKVGKFSGVEKGENERSEGEKAYHDITENNGRQPPLNHWKGEWLQSGEESDDFDVNHLLDPSPSGEMVEGTTDPIVLNAVPTTDHNHTQSAAVGGGGQYVTRLIFEAKVAILRRRGSKCAANDRFFLSHVSVRRPEQVRQSGGVINLKASFITAFSRQRRRQLCSVSSRPAAV